MTLNSRVLSTFKDRRERFHWFTQNFIEIEILVTFIICFTLHFFVPPSYGGILSSWPQGKRLKVMFTDVGRGRLHTLIVNSICNEQRWAIIKLHDEGFVLELCSRFVITVDWLKSRARNWINYTWIWSLIEDGRNLVYSVVVLAFGEHIVKFIPYIVKTFLDPFLPFSLIKMDWFVNLFSLSLDSIGWTIITENVNSTFIFK